MQDWPTRAECLAGPIEKDAVWALRDVEFGDQTLLAPIELFEAISERLAQTGFVHVDRVRALADDEGWVDVERLPVQQIEWERLGEGGRWVEFGKAHHDSLLDQLPPEAVERLLAEAKDRGMV